MDDDDFLEGSRCSFFKGADLFMSGQTVADPEGFHRFPLKPPLLDNVYNNSIHLQQRYTATLDSKETSLPSFKFVYLAITRKKIAGTVELRRT